ncbi:hypothetical protein EUGRSUZ_G01756 [Eucalyptus grandis]|uniref:Uncharacterized protein n=2 Tax=Eucalyptus grandis TaxID=71139 RepID=A0ACC3K4R7_EUCGR|nr:hypothetical protein EUGRSUZ_G01756 [Eucalyptus grandis]
MNQASKQAGAKPLLNQPRHDCIDITFAITNKLQAFCSLSQKQEVASFLFPFSNRQSENFMVVAQTKTWRFSSVLNVQVRSFCKT